MFGDVDICLFELLLIGNGEIFALIDFVPKAFMLLEFGFTDEDVVIWVILSTFDMMDSEWYEEDLMWYIHYYNDRIKQ